MNQELTKYQVAKVFETKQHKTPNDINYDENQYLQS